MTSIPLVINGLHRSGTTMTERLFDSQSNVVCFTLFFQMIRAIAYLRGFRDKGEIMTEDFERAPNLISPKSFLRLRMVLLEDLANRIYSLLIHDQFEATADDRLFGLDKETLLGFMDVIARHETPNDIAALLQLIGDRIGVRVCATRWTAHHRYAPMFLRNPSAYWIEVIRNPYARFASEQLSHAGNLDVVLKQQQDSMDFLSEFRHERHKIIRYEDLCGDTASCLAELSDWLGVDIRDVDLVNALGGPFKPNTSDNVIAGRDIYYQDAATAARIGALDFERWRRRLNDQDIAVLNHSLDFRGFYEQEPVGAAANVRGRFKAAHIRTGAGVKRAIKRVMGVTGYTIGRRPGTRTI